MSLDLQILSAHRKWTDLLEMEVQRSATDFHNVEVSYEKRTTRHRAL